MKVLRPQRPRVQPQVEFPSCSLTDGLSCVPTEFSRALVKTPQGGEVVQTLESCEMKEKCYRVSQVEYYYEIVPSFAGRRQERLKVGFLQLGQLWGGFSHAAGPTRGQLHPGRAQPTLAANCSGKNLPFILS